jgi:CRISPR-associated exonuclease Cas4
MMPLALTLILLAVALWLYATGLRQSTGVPEGEILMSDSGAWQANDQTLYTADLHLAGKPDYLVRQPNGALVPVEVKSSPAPRHPHESHILQLAAYCYLVEVNYGARPPYGLIQYRDGAFEVPYTAELEDELLDTIALMREDLFAPHVPRQHNERSRCAHCGHRPHCQDHL